MNKIDIFDPALCCPTGVCGPSVDPELTRMASAVFLLEKKGFDIKRFNLASDPSAFVDHKEINKLLHEKGPDSLPAVLLNGELVKAGEYPSNSELAQWCGIKPEELTEKKPKIKLDLN
ncbi:arsenite efflux transporter metallochaperone ArsD [Rossellomorea vietnamensis]|uniref:Arsenite efflux transporter metallochaperone ArsD n=1 Tax=Rossellomorea vietnamensis TaxID=218284 RepID=A0A5D4P287_9BACI|nr:arsenite efflux transporter metallochaperone ArsD [Rossellomorea vietnamensis]TYS19836.1 arsenite efflux transporter metallochaperone ArsD [Rossellomorea vietnamensis]